MSANHTFDAVIIGAGPAGTCVALRLLAYGYRVAIVERLPFPRPQVGESLSPGVWDVLALVDADTEIRRNIRVVHSPSQVLWESREPQFIAAEARGSGGMVDRGEFDTRLINLAARRGATIFQPARVRRIVGTPSDWTLHAAGPGGDFLIHADVVVDARGRRSRPPTGASASGPTTLAVWSHTEPNVFSRETRVEAIARAWLWGAPIVEGPYRVMAFFDPSLRSPGTTLEILLRGLMADAKLFEPAAAAHFTSPVFVRGATPYLEPRSWPSGVVRVGERVQALDPLSATGVEKSLRGALLAAIAIHTALREPSDTDLARTFYANHLAESYERHARWTRTYYRQAWPGPEHTFWRDRSTHSEETSRPSTLPTRADTVASPGLMTDYLRLSTEARIISIPCVVDDRIQLRQAVYHPGLERPFAFLENVEVVPLLQPVTATPPLTLGQYFHILSRSLPASVAIRILLWLLRHDVLTSLAVNDSDVPVPEWIGCPRRAGLVRHDSCGDYNPE